MSNELLLGVNIDHIATIRNARGTMWPDPVQAAFIAEQAGADSITVHLREDRRHITDRDILLLRQTIQTEMNLEMAVTEEMLSIACKLIPHYCCLVPEKRQELTTEGGLDVINKKDKLHRAISRLHDAGIQVTLFIDADDHQITAAADIGVTCIEIHTGAYADTLNQVSRHAELVRITKSVNHANMLGLNVHAGHGLNYHNIKSIASLAYIQRVNIGHAIISRSVISGLANAVREMKYLIKGNCD
ncbi:pyridoxine 5'-phosphate synthase [Candidatus Curculioniphilus buchneri]|uniref:pyridoxine 5'-phosphate synthase n=1 Tax=Candidatus Curculioniphilus buchneri TaxID=690594 RepID=UPI00376F383F